MPSDAAIRTPGVDGVAIRIRWNVLQPEAGRFDWTLFDAIAKPTIAARKQLSIGLIAGESTPEWLAGKGVPFSRFTISRRQCLQVNVAHPWSEAYIAEYLRTMAAIRDRLRQLGGLDLVYNVKITGIAQHTLELRLPYNNRCSDQVDAEWAKAGYRPQRVLAAWTRMADGVARLYPGKLLVQPILQVQGFPAIDDQGRAIPRREVRLGDEIISTCIRTFGPRCAVQWNALSPNGRLAARVLEAKEDGATIGWQTNLYEGFEGAGCQVDRRAETVPCTEQTYLQALRRGAFTGAAFLEVWEPDILRYPAAFSELKRDPVQPGEPGLSIGPVKGSRRREE